jgi:hypothetical protein
MKRVEIDAQGVMLVAHTRAYQFDRSSSDIRSREAGGFVSAELTAAEERFEIG